VHYMQAPVAEGLTFSHMNSPSVFRSTVCRLMDAPRVSKERIAPLALKLRSSPKGASLIKRRKRRITDAKRVVQDERRLAKRTHRGNGRLAG
jgi:hypothetical protein